MNIDDETQKKLGSKVPRWINDTDTRVVDAQRGGYEFVEGDVKTGDAAKQENKNRRIRKPVGKNKDGSTRYAYFMAIDKEFYEEDQKVKEATNMQVDNAIRGGQPQGVQPHGINPSQGQVSVKNIEYNP
jgi:hypothetical protein